MFLQLDCTDTHFHLKYPSKWQNQTLPSFIGCLFVSVLQIIEHQNEIWDLQNKDVNGTAGDQIKGTLDLKCWLRVTRSHSRWLNVINTIHCCFCSSAKQNRHTHGSNGQQWSRKHQTEWVWSNWAQRFTDKLNFLSFCLFPSHEGILSQHVL